MVGPWWVAMPGIVMAELVQELSLKTWQDHWADTQLQGHQETPGILIWLAVIEYLVRISEYVTKTSTSFTFIVVSPQHFLWRNHFKPRSTSLLGDTDQSRGPSTRLRHLILRRLERLQSHDVNAAILKARWQSSRFLSKSWVGWWNSPQSHSSTFAFWEKPALGKIRNNSWGITLAYWLFPDSNRYRKIGLDQLGTNTYRELDACCAGSTQLLLRMRSLLTVSLYNYIYIYMLWWIDSEFDTFTFTSENNIKQHFFCSFFNVLYTIDLQWFDFNIGNTHIVLHK